MPIRGSSFNNTSNGGPAALNLNNPRSNSNNNVSFRSASPHICQIVTPTSGRVPCVWVKGVLLHSEGEARQTTGKPQEKD
ncbi:hypothetical protein [Clostridium phage Saumur]|nr:hypothetical protein [Clostridium phage Saumur]